MGAADVYELTVVPHRRRWSRPLRVLGQVALSALTLDPSPLSVGEYVVRRRADGREVLRVAGDVEGESTTFDHLREQLDTLSEGSFREKWGIGS